MRLITILFIWASAIIYHKAHSAEWFVSDTGRDGNPGTSSAPFQTLSRAAQLARAGDTVTVKPGVYLEDLRLQVGDVKWRGPGARVRSVDIRASRITWESFEHAGPLPPWSAAVRIAGIIDEVVIRDCYIHDLVNAYGIAFQMISKGRTPDQGPQRCVIEGNRLERVGYINVNLFGRGHTVSGNLIKDSFGEGDAFRIWGADHDVRGNTMLNVGGGAPEGFTGGGHPDLLQVFGNNAIDSYNILIRDNVAIGGKCQITQIESANADIRDWTIQNNVFVDMAMGGANSMAGIWYRHNTFIRCNRVGGHTFVLAPPGYARGASVRSGIVNNAFIECGSNPSNNTYGWFGWPDKLDDLVVEGNFVCGPQGAPKRTGSGSRMWRWQTAYGVNGGDPLIDSDGRPQSGSPLIGRGVAKWSVSRDAAGNLRLPGVNPTVGAFEVPQ